MMVIAVIIAALGGMIVAIFAMNLAQAHQLSRYGRVLCPWCPAWIAMDGFTGHCARQHGIEGDVSGN